MSLAESTRVPSRSKATSLMEVMEWTGSGIGFGELFAHLFDDRAVILGAEDGGARHEGVGTGRGDLADVVGLHAAVDLEADVGPALLDHLASLLELDQALADEGLAAEARVHGHDQHHVQQSGRDIRLEID